MNPLYLFLMIFFSIPCFVLSADLDIQKTPDQITVSHAGSPGIPPWEAIISKSNGGNLTEIHVPPGTANLGRGVTDFPFFVPQNLPGDGTKRNFTGFDVPIWELLKETGDSIIIKIGGNRVGYQHERTYVITKKGIVLEGFIELNDGEVSSKFGFWCPFLLSRINHRADRKLPIRSQNSSNWTLWSDASGDSYRNLPSGVDFPLTFYFGLKQPGWFIQIYYDKVINNSFKKMVYNDKRDVSKDIVTTATGMTGLRPGDRRYCQYRIEFVDSNTTGSTGRLGFSDNRQMQSRQGYLFPNPSPFLAVSWTTGNESQYPPEITLFDIRGRQIYSSHVPRRTSHMWNAHDCPAGSYILKIHKNGKSTFHKFSLIR